MQILKASAPQARVLPTVCCARAACCDSMFTGREAGGLCFYFPLEPIATSVQETMRCHLEITHRLTHMHTDTKQKSENQTCIFHRHQDAISTLSRRSAETSPACTSWQQVVQRCQELKTDTGFGAARVPS